MTRKIGSVVALAVASCASALFGYEYDLVDNLKLKDGKTITRRMVVGYRGECAEEPGNTKRAVDFSVSRGFPVAVDALTTADGVLIAAADPAFAARKWTDDLEKFDAGTLAIETWPNKFRDCGYRLAKFEEIVAAAKGPLVVRIADGKAATAEAVRRFKDVEIVDAVEPIDDPVKAVAAFEGGATRIFSTGPAKLFTRIEGLLARERVMKTDFRAKLVAHAGGRECAPENTLPAFRNMQTGGFSVEADFHLSKDGVVFLTHEHWMNHPKSCIHDKMANELNWTGELENADAGWWIGEKWKGTKFCTMDELFDTITPDRTLVLHIATSGPEIIEKIKEGFARHPSISPKNAVFFADARTVHKILPDYVVGGCPLPRKGWMQHDEPNDVRGWAEGWKKGPADAFTGPRWDNELISRQYVETLHRKGVTVCVWSIDDPYLALAALDRGVDLVESDRPESIYREMTGEQVPKPIKYNGIALDGVPDEDRWRDAKWHDDFTRLKIHKDKGAFARKTEFAVWATSVDLYVAARCYVDDVEEMKKRPETDMWLADNFEVFLSPSGAEAAYYHFAVSPNSKTPMAEYFEEAGHIQPDFYMPRWEAKTAWETNAWTCEIQIPLTAFYWTRQADWKTEWRVNFCRTLQKPYELATWSPLEQIFHEPGAFRLMEGMPYRCRGWDGCIRKATATILEQRADGSLRGEMDVDCHIPFDRACRVTSDCGSSELRDFKAGDHHIRFPCAFKKGGRIRTNFKLEYKGGNVAAERDYPVWVEYRPIDLRLTKPAYRGNFYPGQCADEVAGEVEILGGGEATVTLEGPGFPARSAKIAGKGTFAFDTKGFEKGEARLTVRTAKDERTVKVRNLPKSAHRMTWIEDGNLVVDGKPVLRRNMYSGTYMMGEKFIELYTADAPNFHATPACDRFVGIEPGHLAPGLEREEAIFDNPPSAKVYAKLDEIIAKNRDSDFCAYYICDEPECRGISPVYLKYIYDYVADKDPYHVINSATRGGKTYIDCLDWAETHPYINARNTPEGRKYDRPFSEIGRFIDDFDAAGRPDKCIGFLPTCFAYRWQTLESDYPTFDEYLVHTWAAVVRGAKTIWPYAAHDLGDRPQLHEGTRYLFSSFEALEDLILFGARKTLRKDKSAEVALWTRGDDALLVALNFTDRPQTVTFEGAGGSFREFRGTRTVGSRSSDSKLQAPSFKLKPYETFVATTRPHDAGLKPVAEVRAAIDRAEAERKSRDNQLLERYAQLKVRDNLRANFGGGLYKLFDGTRQMIARWAQGSPENWMEIEFRDGLKPVFDRVVVHGCGLIGRMEVSVPDGDGWRKVAVKSRANEAYRAEVELAETVAPAKVRLDFPGEKNQVNRLEIYEVELPRK